MLREDLNKINALKNKLDINYINHFNNNNGGILENGLSLLFNIGEILENSLFNTNGGGDGDSTQLDGVRDDDFTQYINDKEEYAKYTGLMQYISQHALRNVEGGDISSIHKFPTHNLSRFIAPWLNYGKASGSNPTDTDGAAQYGHASGEMDNTHPANVRPRAMRCSNYGVTCQTNGETYYSSTTHPAASVLLELSHGRIHASKGWGSISSSIIRAVVTQHRLIRLLTQRTFLLLLLCGETSLMSMLRRLLHSG